MFLIASLSLLRPELRQDLTRGHPEMSIKLIVQRGICTPSERRSIHHHLTQYTELVAGTDLAVLSEIKIQKFHI